MSIVKIGYPAPPGRPFVVKPAHPKVEIVGQRGRKVELPFAPVIEHGNLARRFTVSDRIGRQPRLSQSGKNLKTQTCDLFVARKDPQVSIETLLRELRALRGDRVYWRHLGPSEGGLFRMTDVSMSEERRQHGTNHLTRARISWILTEIPDANLQVGTISGGAKDPRPSGELIAELEPIVMAPGGSSSIMAATGASLASLAYEAYGDPELWRDLADANGIRDPRTLAAGDRLLAPADLDYLD